MIDACGGVSVDRQWVTLAVIIVWHSFGVTAWSVRLRVSPGSFQVG